MAIIRKVLSGILIASIMISILTSAAMAGTSIPELSSMATALNKLNILQGSNGNYLLNNKIERSQAAALIIRLLGKENFVKQNSEQLKFTKYADVSSKEWYAPYVGYCTQYNIMGGYPDGRFAPKDYISEKSFLKMALCALGYGYNSDFDWSNVYQKAYSVGIVKDASYSSRIQDNSNYLRSGAVQVLFHSLNTVKKGTSTKMAFTLVDEGVFTRDFINASGILGAVKPVEIDIITATGFNSIEVNLNQNIQNVSAADISITETVSSTSSAVTVAGLTVQSAAFSGDRIQVITSGQIPNKEYTVKIKGVTDAGGNVSGQLTGAFRGFVRQQVVSDFFKISKVEQTAQNEIKVYFTHPVNANCETPGYYEILKNGSTYIAGNSQNITVKKLPSEANSVSILLRNTNLASGGVYSLKISGRLTSSYGVKLGEGSGESIDFATTASEAGQLSVSSINAWTSTSVRIIFNRDVDPGWAEKFLNYTVYDPYKNVIAVTKAAKAGTGDSGGRTIMLTLASSLDKTKQYEVKMEYIPDIYKQSSIEGKSFTFSGAYPENMDLAIAQTICEYNNCVVLNFNRPLDASTATNVTNYVIRGDTDGTFVASPIKIFYEDTYGVNTAKLYLPAGKNFSGSQKYTIYATGLKDSSGVAQSGLLRTQFTGSSYSAVKPQIADAVMVSKDTVKLLFNLEIAFNLNNIKTSNYSLEYVENGETYKIEPIGVTYVDARTLVLRFDGLDPAKNYQVKFSSINDFSEVYSRTAAEGGNSASVRQGR